MRLPHALFLVSLAAALGLGVAGGLSAHDLWSGTDALVKDSFGVAHAQGSQNDSAAVAATMERFHAAFVAGDSATALALLAPDVVVLESGGVETRDEYRAQHLPADIAFAIAVKSDRGPMRVVVRGDVAWVTSTSTSQGEYRGRQVNSAGAELAVLTRTPQGWRIVALHWSSRSRRPPGS